MKCQKHLFELDKNHHYLNCAFLSPLLKSVGQAGEEGIRSRNRPWEVSPDDFFDNSGKLRRLFASLINAGSSDRVAILPSVSYGMAIAARNLPVRKGGNIVVAGEQFPSNVYPWMRYCDEQECELNIIDPPVEQSGRGKEWNQRILEVINRDTVLVALSNVHWTDGTRFDLEEIGKAARDMEARLVIDGTQSVGALPFDLQKVQPDALICAGYKWLMGPYGTALGYFGPQFLDGVPLEEGWIVRKNSRNFAALVDYETDYEPGALRYDVGERSNFINVPMMVEALEQILEWGPGGIQEYCRKICSGEIRNLREQGFFIEDEEWRGSHLFGVRLPESVSPNQLQKKLAEKNIHVSIRGTAVRVAPNVYNTEEDLHRLGEVLVESVQSHGSK